MLIDSPHLVRPGKRFKLANVDTRFTGKFEDKAEGLAAAKKNVEAMHDLQERLYAEAKRSLLIILQAMDTGGKDGTIEFVFGSVDPQGCVVTSYKAPNSTELAHDYLWRIHGACPRRGMLGIHNRSHYEDVLVPYVMGWIDARHRERRFGHINAFEQMLVDEGTYVLKVMLHISKDEQKERLIARQQRPEKHWKFDAADLEARKHWDKYMSAYEETINATSTEVAPWYVVPADRKWYRNFAVSEVIVKALEQLDPRFPKVAVDPRQYVVE